MNLVERAAGGVLSRTGLAGAPRAERAGRASPPLHWVPTSLSLSVCLTVSLSLTSTTFRPVCFIKYLSLSLLRPPPPTKARFAISVDKNIGAEAGVPLAHYLLPPSFCDAPHPLLPTFAYTRTPLTHPSHTQFNFFPNNSPVRRTHATVNIMYIPLMCILQYLKVHTSQFTPHWWITGATKNKWNQKRYRKQKQLLALILFRFRHCSTILGWLIIF